MTNSGSENLDLLESSSLSIGSGSSSIRRGRKRSYHNKVVVHDIFLKCAEIVKEDSYWKDVFIDAAYGKFLAQPYYVKDGILIYSKGTTVNQLKLSNDPRKTSSESIAFFQTTGGYHSRKDILNDKAKRCEFEKDVINSNKKREWNNYSRSMRKFMITRYCEQMVKEYNLSQYEKECLFDLLIIGMSIGYLCKATVEMHDVDNIIEKVACLEWDKDKRKFYFINIPKSKQVPTISPQNPIPHITDIALTRDKAKFCDSYSKRMSKHFDNSSGKKKKDIDKSQNKEQIIDTTL